MDSIEKIWDKGNEKISKDDTLSEAFIRKSISETSISITSKLAKIIWVGLIVSILAAAGFSYNIFFYLNNIAILGLVIILLLTTVLIFLFLLRQLNIVNKMDTKEFDLNRLLQYKINYFTTQFQIVQHVVAISIVLATFTINLTMENSDGIFEFRKIAILTLFYLFIYAATIFLYKVSYSVYLKQLRNALFNLEENTLKSFDKELNKHKRIRKLIGIIIASVLIFGMIFLFLQTSS